MDGKLQTKTPAEFFAENRNIAGFDNVRLRRAAQSPSRLAAALLHALSRRCCLRPAAPCGRARHAPSSAACHVLRGAAGAD